MSAISSVRGIGVAVIVSTSTCARSCFSRSLWETPKRCSSSTTSSPRSLNRTSRPSSRCVPITTSTVPSAASSTTCFCAAGWTNRDSIFTVTGNGAKRSRERHEVLFGEQRRRDEHRDLRPVHHRLERRADRDLGLAEPHVATEEPVHRERPFHVVLDLVDHPDLVGRLLERERILELALPRHVRSERVSRHRHPNRVEPHELARHVANSALDLGRGARPVRAAHPVHARDVAAEVFRDHADRVRRHVELVVRRVLQDEVVALGAGERSVDDAGVAADPVDPMHGEVARFQLLRDRIRPPAREPRRRARVAAGPEDVLLGHDRELRRGEDEPVRQRRFDRLDGRRTEDLSRALQGTVTAPRDDRAIPACLQVSQPWRDLGRVALCRPPGSELEIEPFGELRQLELHAPGDGVVQRVERPGTRPGERVGERLGFVVRRRGAVQRSARLREDDPRPVGQELRGRREPVEQERRRGLHPLGMQTVRDPLQEIGEPVGLANRLGSGSCPDVAVRDQLPDRARPPRGPDARSRAASTRRTRGATRSRRPSTPGAPAGARRPGRRRARRRGRRTRRGARRRRRGDTRARRAVRPARRAGVRAQRPARSAGTVPSVGIRPCIAARTGATRTVAPRCSRRRRTAAALRAATSGAGEMPSYGNASQAGSSATSPGRNASRSSARASASWGPGATASTAASSATASPATTNASPVSARAWIGRSRASRRRSKGSDPTNRSKASRRLTHPLPTCTEQHEQPRSRSRRGIAEPVYGRSAPWLGVGRSCARRRRRRGDHRSWEAGVPGVSDARRVPRSNSIPVPAPTA